MGQSSAHSAGDLPSTGAHGLLSVQEPQQAQQQQQQQQETTSKRAAEEITATPQKGVRGSVLLEGGPSATEDSRTGMRRKAKGWILVSETTPSGLLRRTWIWGYPGKGERSWKCRYSEQEDKLLLSEDGDGV